MKRYCSPSSTRRCPPSFLARSQTTAVHRSSLPIFCFPVPSPFTSALPTPRHDCFQFRRRTVMRELFFFQIPPCSDSADIHHIPTAAFR
ncbi:hypothetical protein Dsin_016261 [Dipteronia sinensis]|uniref:Uncharacterized protein n=1 Tax=Dipteronia sinensis TaxID=43782 RepID=A0AAE0AE61_9ROSI|nr:hypothetical protein Dsin_016261 [Dipteronia sinensis]